MKKYLSFIMAGIMMVCCLQACGTGNGSGSNGTAAGNDRLRIVATIFPEYDWVMNILGKNPADAEVSMLLDNGIDLHSFQPTADDILNLSTCDLFIYVGGESDDWVKDALEEVKNKDMTVIRLMDVLGSSVKVEELVEGMQEHDHDHDEAADDHDDDEAADDHDHDEAADDHDHDEAADEHDHDDGEAEYDEHVWLSLRNAAVFVQRIADSIQRIDPDHAEVYKSNASAYIEKLNSLDKEYGTAVQNAAFRTILFGDRFPFRYLVDDYGLDYYAAFAGCSAETEASFATVTFLARKVDELGLPAVMTIEGTDHRIAETIVRNTQAKDQQILTMDSMQGTTSGDVQNGTTYLSVMENNLSVLNEALN